MENYLSEIFGILLSFLITTIATLYIKNRENKRKALIAQDKLAELENNLNDKEKEINRLKNIYDISYDIVPPFFGKQRPNLEEKDLKVISIMNHKGGVGKTTIALHLSFYLSKYYDKKILMVDLDNQGNLSVLTLGINRSYWLKISKELSSLEGLIKEFKENNLSIKSINNYTHRTVHKFNNDYLPVDIIPQIGWFELDKRLEEFQFGLWYNVHNIDIRNIWKDIKKLEKQYDYIIFDCPPNLGFLTQSAIIYSDFIFTPIVLDDFSYHGFGVFQEWLDRLSGILNINDKKISSFIINKVRINNGQPIDGQLTVLEEYMNKNNGKYKKLIPPRNTYIISKPRMFSTMALEGPNLLQKKDTRPLINLTEYIYSIINKEN